MNKQQYVEECISEIFSEHGVVATLEQQSAVARDIQFAMDGWGQCSYQPPDPAIAEISKLKQELAKERSKVGCSACGGRGRIVYDDGPWAVNTQCDKCNGDGKVTP